MKIILCLLVASSGITCKADTIRLRNGKELEGKIVSEEKDHYVAMVKVTETISDRMTIPRLDVLEIVAEKPDETAFEAIQALVPTPDLLTTEEYDSKIRIVSDFLSKYPKSLLVKKAMTILNTLEEEADVVSNGGIKFRGTLISAEERARTAYTLDSQIAAHAVTDPSQLNSALRAWANLEEKFPTSRAFIDTKPAAIQLMKARLTAVRHELENFEMRMEERREGLQRMTAKDRTRTERLLKEQSDNYLRTLEAEKEAGIKWISLHPDHKAPMDKMETLLEREIERLEGLNTALLPDGDHAWEQAWSTLHGDPSREEAREVLDAARKAKLPDLYMDRLQAMAPK